jgi:hypothetical protein
MARITAHSPQALDFTIRFANVTTTPMRAYEYMLTDYNENRQKQAGMKSNRSYCATI